MDADLRELAEILAKAPRENNLTVKWAVVIGRMLFWRGIRLELLPLVINPLKPLMPDAASIG